MVVRSAARLVTVHRSPGSRHLPRAVGRVHPASRRPARRLSAPPMERDLLRAVPGRAEAHTRRRHRRRRAHGRRTPKLRIADTGTAVTRPGLQHWVSQRGEIEGGLRANAPLATQMVELARRKVADFESPAIPAPPAKARTMRQSADTPFESHFTASIPQILQQARRSLAISTYKSGHVIIARADGPRRRLAHRRADERRQHPHQVTPPALVLRCRISAPEHQS